MKKVLSIVLVLLTIFSCSLNAMAVDFTPSAENKGAPEFVDREENGIYDSNGNLIDNIDGSDFEIIGFGEVINSDILTDEEKQLMQDLFEKLSDPNTKLSVLCPELNDYVKKHLGKDYTADDLVIRDFFTIKELNDKLKEYDGKGNIKITFDLGIGADEFIAAMVYIDGKWQLVPLVNNGDGTVTITLSKLGPVAFLTLKDNLTSPATGDVDYNQILLWSGVMVVALGGIVVVLCTSRKKKNNAE